MYIYIYVYGPMSLDYGHAGTDPTTEKPLQMKPKMMRKWYRSTHACLRVRLRRAIRSWNAQYLNKSPIYSPPRPRLRLENKNPSPCAHTHVHVRTREGAEVYMRASTQACTDTLSPARAAAHLHQTIDDIDPEDFCLEPQRRIDVGQPGLYIYIDIYIDIDR